MKTAATKTALACVVVSRLAAQAIDVIHNFTGGPDGGSPQTTLTEVSPNNFVGTDAQVIFQVSSNNFKLLHTFDETTGFFPLGPLFQASNGFLYGASDAGLNSTTGSTFIASLDGSFSIIKPDTYFASSFIEASDGKLYGVAASKTGGDFVVYRMTQSGDIQVLRDIGPNGLLGGPLLQASDGNFYGMTASLNGTAGFIFKMTLAGEYSVLHTFEPGTGGIGGLTEGTDGKLYGSSQVTNPPCPSIDGAVFSLTFSGEFKNVHTFWSCYGAGYGPTAGVIQASDGYLWGVTGLGGGPLQDGEIFQLALDGSSLNVPVYFTFANGAGPGIYGPAFVQGTDGAFYGTTVSGGAFQQGVIYHYNASLPPPLPSVGYFHPQTGAPGTTVTIGGTHLVGLTGVTFNGTPATTIASRGNNFVTAVVPAGATSGPITVTTVNGSKTSKAGFTVQ